MMVVLFIGGLSACHAGFGIGDNGQGRTDVASDALGVGRRASLDGLHERRRVGGLLISNVRVAAPCGRG
jgi:hypothetical protein